MVAQPLRAVPFSPALDVHPKVAVLLNAHARKVNGQVLRALAHIVPDEDLYLSRSELDSRRIAQAVVEKRYHTAFLGGGDGTFVHFVNEIFRQLDRTRRPPPRFGVLKLGTGNGLASAVNASSPRDNGILDDVLRAKAGEVPGYLQLDLLTVDGRRTPFAGVGLDGKLVNDYIWVKQNFAKGLLKRWMTGPGGYFSAITLKTLPQCLVQSTWFEAEVVNSSSKPAFRLDFDGRPTGEPIAPGELLFKGRAMMLGAATIPSLGYQVRIFPHAGQKPGCMHLRLAALSSLQVLSNVPQIWSGTLRSKDVYDFSAQDVTVKMDRPMPFQLGGDAEGYRDELRISVSEQPIEVVDFSGAVN